MVELSPQGIQAINANEYLSRLSANIHLAFNNNGPDIQREMARRGMQRHVIDVLPEDLAIACSIAFDFKTPPNKHDGSDAEYYIDGHETPDGHIIYLSGIKPNGTTSFHKHIEGVTEHYVKLFGEAFINNERMPNMTTVHPGNYHQVTTRGNPALLLILMENGARVPKHLRHIS